MTLACRANRIDIFHELVRQRKAVLISGSDVSLRYNSAIRLHLIDVFVDNINNELKLFACGGYIFFDWFNFKTVNKQFRLSGIFHLILISLFVFNSLYFLNC